MIKSNKINFRLFHKAFFKLAWVSFWKNPLVILSVVVLMPILTYASIALCKILLEFDIGSNEMDPTCIIRKGFIDATFVPMLPMFISIVPFVLTNIVQNTFFNEQCYSLSMRKRHSVASVAILSLVFFVVFYLYLFVLALLFNCTQLDAVFGSNEGYLRFDPGAFLISILYMCIAFISMTLIVVFVPKSFVTQTIVAALFYSLSILFSGNVIPIYWLQSNVFLLTISYIDPFRYTSSFTLMAAFTSTGAIDLLNANPGGVWSPNHIFWLPLYGIGESSAWVGLYKPWDIWLAWLLPLTFPLISLGCLFGPDWIKRRQWNLKK